MKYPENSKYNFFSPSADNFKVYLKASCYEVRGTANFLEGPFCFSDCWVLDHSLNTESLNRLSSESNEWELRGMNCAHLYPPGCRYWDKPLAGTSIYRGAYIMFAGGELVGLNKYVKNSRGFCCFYDEQNLLANLLIESAGMLTPLGSDGFYIGQSYLFKLIDAMHQFRPGKSDWERRTQEPGENGIDDIFFVRCVRQYLQENFTKNITLDEIAHALKVSKSTLSHKFREISGESPFQALISIRINAVKALLLKRERLKNIAEQTGFYDEYHLSKMFKRSTGMSPKEFMQSHYNN